MGRTLTRRTFLSAGNRALGGAAMALVWEPRTALRFRTLTGALVDVDGRAVDELRRRFKGELLTRDAPGYDAGRRIWNAAIDRRPALIARCRDVHDIVQALRFAARHHLLVSVRAGGHNAAGFAIGDGALVIDLRAINGVQVDARRRTARVGGGATFADYDAVTGRFGMASTGPIVSMVGVGGYTLGGGVGWLHRTLGLASDRLISAQVVTADGRIVEASATRHADLFWALRGGGGNFGIVSAFEFSLAPVTTVLAGLIFHPLAALPELAALVRGFNDNAPDDVSVWMMLRRAPASPALPVAMHGRPVATIAVCCTAPERDAARIVEPLRRFGRPLLDQVSRRSYREWQQSLDGAWGDGFGNRWLGHYLPELSDASAQTMLEHVSRVTSPFTDVKLVTLGGAVARVGEDETAFSFRRSKYALVLQTRWAHPGAASEHIAWSRAFFDGMKPHGTGNVYVNFMDDGGVQPVRDAYNARAFERLRRTKTAYDPRNVFRMNQNIPPG